MNFKILSTQKGLSKLENPFIKSYKFKVLRRLHHLHRRQDPGRHLNLHRL